MMSLILKIAEDILAIIRDGGDEAAVKTKVQQRLMKGIADLGGVDERLDELWADLRRAVPGGATE